MIGLTWTGWHFKEVIRVEDSRRVGLQVTTGYSMYATDGLSYLCQSKGPAFSRMNAKIWPPAVSGTAVRYLSRVYEYLESKCRQRLDSKLGPHSSHPDTAYSGSYFNI